MSFTCLMDAGSKFSCVMSKAEDAATRAQKTLDDLVKEKQETGRLLSAATSDKNGTQQQINGLNTSIATMPGTFSGSGGYGTNGIDSQSVVLARLTQERDRLQTTLDIKDAAEAHLKAKEQEESSEEDILNIEVRGWKVRKQLAEQAMKDDDEMLPKATGRFKMSMQG